LSSAQNAEQLRCRLITVIMPPDRRNQPGNIDRPPHDYDANPQWRSKPLTPAHILVSDIRLESLRAEHGPMLEVNEKSPSLLVPDDASLPTAAGIARASQASVNPIEERRFQRLEDDFGWIRHLRLKEIQRSADDPEHFSKCRWIHCSSKYPEYLGGFLFALTENTKIVSESMQLLEIAVQQNQRFSKHGKHFVPFVAPLTSGTQGSGQPSYPMLISTTWLDWSINGKTPPLRFQVDRKEGYSSSRSACHPLRSLLAYYFRLEDTRERDRSQVFTKHKPWTTNREIDLKIRQWYGHYPTALNVDELWLLAIDAEHIVTFSSNQTWKARWPPLQLTSRISDVAFRDIRNMFYRSQQHDTQEYTAMTHIITSLSGAMGMMHRSFWQDLPLCVADRYAGHLGHLQYRLHRAPSTKLVMDLLACQEELNIVIQITQQQLDLIAQIQALAEGVDVRSRPSPTANGTHRAQPQVTLPGDPVEYMAPRHRATYRHLTASNFNDPIAKLEDNLQRELADLQDLRDNANTLVSRTIQLVNIRLEDHGKAILVFTVVTIIFLPLNFVSSFFGMNTRDIRDMNATQSLFWLVAICVTAGVLGASIFLAFQGGDILEKLHLWLDARRERTANANTTLLKAPANVRTNPIDRGKIFKL
jgi:Mg2+ and Co2+ transporter CorA